MNLISIYIGIICLLFFSPNGNDCTCTWPSAFQNSVWEDSDHGAIIFNSTHLSGWTVNAYNGFYSETVWECHLDSGGFLIFRSVQPLQVFSLSNYLHVCIKLTQVTEYSYYYYNYSPSVPDANYEQITWENDIVSANTAGVCTYMPQDSEIHTLVKQGFSASAKVNCPDVFLGTFSYTFNDGTTSCGTNSQVDVCTDKQSMQFDYTKCGTQVAHSAAGVVSCVVSRQIGSTFYAVVYNSDTTVDESTTYRFTCFMADLASDGSVQVSQAPQSCKSGQTTTARPVNLAGTTIGAVLVLTMSVRCACSWPTSLQSGTWEDSDHGSLVFNDSYVTGWPIANVTQWSCHNDSSGYIVFKSIQTANVSSVTYSAYTCLNLTSISSTLYSYYLHSSQNTNFNNERVKLLQLDDLNMFLVSSICDSTPDEKEFHVMVKDGTAATSKQVCPSALHDQFWYTFNNGTSNLCGTNQEKWDSETDTSAVSIDYTLCNDTLIAHSASGQLYCMASLTVGTEALVSLYNTDTTVNDMTTYRFTCLMLNSTSGGNVILSQAPMSCTPSQSSSTQPVNAAGQTVGATLILSPIIITTTTTTTIALPTTTSAFPILPVVLGAAGGLLLLLLILAIAAYWWWRTRPKPTPPPTPDIDNMEHFYFPVKVPPRSIAVAPRETTFLADNSLSKFVDVFPDIRTSTYAHRKPFLPDLFKDMPFIASNPNYCSDGTLPPVGCPI